VKQDVAPQTPSRTFLDLCFAPSMQQVPVVRDFVTSFYKNVFGDRDGLSRLEVTAHELVENAVKNSTDGVTRLRIDYDPVRWIVTVRTLNVPTIDNLGTLRESIREMHTTTDPDAYYQAVLHRSAKQAVGSGLGLARVWVEAGFKIRCELEATGGVWVIAESRVQGRTEARS